MSTLKVRIKVKATRYLWRVDLFCNFTVKALNFYWLRKELWVYISVGIYFLWYLIIICLSKIYGFE